MGSAEVRTTGVARPTAPADADDLGLPADVMLLCARWYAKAAQLEGYAKRCRRAGDPREAEAAEESATEWRTEADRLESAGSIAAYRASSWRGE